MVDESALWKNFDEDGAAAAVMGYLLNPWPWFAVGVPITIIAAISLIAYHQRKRGRTKSQT